MPQFTNVTFSDRQKSIACHLASFSEVFRASYPFIRPNDAKEALLGFLVTYAYERQGSARAFRVIAKKIIEDNFPNKLTSLSQSDADHIWTLYKNYAKEYYPNLKGLNAAHNPLNGMGGVISRLSKIDNVNLFEYIRSLIITNETKIANNFLTSITGVGKKISSLYLRDIACYELEPSRHVDPLFQPIDTWIDQAIEIISNKLVRRSVEDKQLFIVALCKEAFCSPIFFNQGAWILGSVVSQDYNTYRKVIENVDEAKKLLQLRIDERDRVTNAMKDWLKSSI
jgi:hypothetical protein